MYTQDIWDFFPEVFYKWKNNGLVHFKIEKLCSYHSDIFIIYIKGSLCRSLKWCEDSQMSNSKNLSQEHNSYASKPNENNCLTYSLSYWQS